MVGRISRNKLKAGDHIYTWRTAYFYAHHGIYVGEDTVIHYTRRTKKSMFKIPISSAPNYEKNPCAKCGYKPKFNSKNVVSSCLDCFLAGDKLYRYKYNAYWITLVTRLRGGTCTTATPDSPEQVVRRAKYLLEHDGFGDYDLLTNNCEDFAIYCKTESVVEEKMVMGGSGQVYAALGYMFALSVTVRTVIRLHGDMGIRKDIVKVPVETLAHQMITLRKSKQEENKIEEDHEQI